jgi:AAA domain
MSADAQTVVPFPDGSQPLPTKKPAAIVKPLVDLQAAKENDGNTLLGNRFLCRAGGLLFVGSSGIGKSTAVIQMGICWAVGRECFGIRPRQPVKILYVQAENDEGDLCEMRDGVLGKLELTKEELDLLDKNFTCVFESSRAGEELVKDALEPLLENHSPDLLILDPALSYIGGSANEQEIVGGFLRNQLNPLLQKHSCGVLIVHHTNKPNAATDGRKKVANDFAYAGTGSAEWANWARAVLVLSAKNDDGLRTLQIGKRFRLGWVDEDGNPTSAKHLKQSAPGETLFYSELTPEENLLLSSKTSPLMKVLRAPSGYILPAAGEDISKEILVARITEKKICGRDKATKEVIPSLVDQGYLEMKEVPRPGKRPEIHFVRTEKIRGRVSFASRKEVSSD